MSPSDPADTAAAAEQDSTTIAAPRSPEQLEQELDTLVAADARKSNVHRGLRIVEIRQLLAAAQTSDIPPADPEAANPELIELMDDEFEFASPLSSVPADNTGCTSPRSMHHSMAGATSPRHWFVGVPASILATGSIPNSASGPISNGDAEKKPVQLIVAPTAYRSQQSFSNATIGTALNKLGVDRDVAWRQKLQLMYHSSGFGILWNIANMVFSLFGCAIYVMDTYEPIDGWLIELDYWLNIYFLFDFILCWFIAEDAQRFWLQWTTWADLTSMLGLLFKSAASAGARLFRIVKMLRLIRAGGHTVPILGSKVTEYVAVLVAVVFILAGLINAVSVADVEQFGSELLFHECIYFIMVTVSTIGYGDISPREGWAMVLVMIMIPVCVTIFSVIVTKIADEVMKDSYGASFRCPKGWHHIVICGHLGNQRRIYNVLTQLFHVDRRPVQLKVLLMGLSRKPPTFVTNAMERIVGLRSRVIYLHGDSSSLHDLSRADVKHAYMVVVLNDDGVIDPSSQDGEQNLRLKEAGRSVDPSIGDAQVATHAFVIKRHYEDVRIIAVMTTDEFREDLEKQHIGTIVTNDVRSHTLAMSLLHPGAQTLLFNLLSCVSVDSECFDHRRKKEYTSGLEWELYRTRVPQAAHGVTLGQLQLDLRMHRMVFVSFAGWSTNFDYGDDKESRFSQPLSVPSNTKMHQDDWIWLMARDWKEIETMLARYSAGCGTAVCGIAELALLSGHCGIAELPLHQISDELAPHKEQQVPCQSPAPQAPCVDVGVAPKQDGHQPARHDAQSKMKLAAELLHSVSDYLESANDPLQARTLQLASNVDELAQSIVHQHRPQVQPNVDILICGQVFKAEMLQLISTVQKNTLAHLSFQMLLAKPLDTASRRLVATDFPELQMDVLDDWTAPALAKTALSTASRVLVFSTEEGWGCRISRFRTMIAATRIAELLLEVAWNDHTPLSPHPALLVEIPRACRAVVGCLQHETTCNHEDDECTLPRMDNYDTNKALMKKIKALSLQGACGSDFKEIQYLLSYEHASGLSVSTTFQDLYLVHMIFQPSFITLLSHLIHMPDPLGDSSEEEHWDFTVPSMRRISIPEAFCSSGTHDGSYGVLFRHCLACEVVPLGLYRQASRTCTADRGYVYTNPPDEEKIHPGDDLYVVADAHWAF